MVVKTLELKPNEKVRAAMIETGYNQETLAKAMGVSLSAFNLKLNGKREFSLSECKIIAIKVGKTLDQIFLS